MLFKIGICDDEAYILREIEKFITCFTVAHDFDFEVHSFQKGTDLLEFHKQNFLDIILLDIELNQENGIQVAKELRKIKAAVPRPAYIIFITSYPKYMQDSFRVQAFQFLQKPVSYAHLEEVLQSVIRHYQSSSLARLCIQCQDCQYNIPIREILYIHCLKEKKNYAEYILTSQILVARANISEIESAGESYGLVSPCRGYIVNINHVRILRDNQLIMDNGSRIDVSRRKLPAVQKIFACNMISLSHM